MKRSITLLSVFFLLSAQVAHADVQTPARLAQVEPGANTQEIPTPILKTGINLTTTSLSPNTLQLSDTIGLTPILEQIQSLKQRVSASSQGGMENLSARVELMEAIQKAEVLIARVNLEIDFTLAEINAETEVYNEVLAKFTGDRDKLVARVNAASFISNGVLWAVCEAFSIGSFNTTFAKNPKKVIQWPIPSGIVGIAAGIVPSIASMYTLRAVNGKKRTSEVEPNMLAKLFEYPTNPEIEYPRSVWEFLHQVPADQAKGKKRLDQIVDRWIADSNMPEFTDRASKKQLDVITGSVAQKKGLTIGTLTARKVMLDQLSAEIMKMKRLLLEAVMVVSGDKQVVAALPSLELRSQAPDAVPQHAAAADKADNASKQPVAALPDRGEIASASRQPTVIQNPAAATTPALSLFEKARSSY